MYLRRFADERGNLTMVDRDRDLPARTVSVNNACNESGYYSIPADDLEEHARDGHDPELVEKLFASIESDAAVVLERIVREQVLPERGSVERFDLALLVSQQITRGWGFRARMEEHVNVLARMHMEPELTAERLGERLRRMGESSGPADVEAYRKEIVEGDWRVRPGRSFMIQQGIHAAYEVALPEVLRRGWRLRVFERPVLLTSDEPVALWSPGPYVPGIGTADTYWWPIDRHHLLSMSTRRVDEVVADAPLSRARQVNQLVAQQAHRWIFQHPDDDGLGDAVLPPRERFVRETVDVTVTPTEVRELVHVVRRREPWGDERSAGGSLGALSARGASPQARNVEPPDERCGEQGAFTRG
jgi:hypothetical protein